MRLVPYLTTIASVVFVSVGTAMNAGAQVSASPVIAVSPDGVEFARVTGDNLIEVRNRTQPESAQPLVTLTGLKDRLTALTFSSDGLYLAGASDDRHVSVWRLSDGRRVGFLEEPSDSQPALKRVSHATSLAFSPSGTELALTDDGFKWIVRFTGSDPTDLHPHGAIVSTAPLLSLAADGRGGWVAGDASGSFHFYDADLTQLSETGSKVAGAIRSMSVSPDGLLLATGGDDREIKVWYFGSAATASVGGHFGLDERLPARGAVVAVTFENDAKTLVFADASANLIKWVVPNAGSRVAGAAPTTGVPVVPGTTAVATTTPPVTVTPPPPPPVTTVTPPVVVPPVTVTPPTTVVPPTVAPPVKTATPPPTVTPPTTVTPPVTVTPPATDTKPPVKPVTPKPTVAVAVLPPLVHQVKASVVLLKSLVGHSDYVNSVAFSRDGRSVASASRDKTVRVWDLETGNQRILGKHDNYVSCVAFSPAGDLLASGGWDNRIKIFLMPDGTPLDEAGKLDKHTSYVLSLAFSPDGKLLADGSNDKTARIFSFADGKSISTPVLPDGIAAVAFSPDGTRLAGGCLDGNVYIWDAKTMAVTQKLPGIAKSPVFCVTFLDNNALVASGRGGLLRIWHIATAKLLATVPAGTQDVFALAYNPVTHLVASGGADHLIRLWNASQLNQASHSVQPLLTAKGHTNTVRAIAFSQDGQTMASGSWDDNILLWTVKADHPAGSSTAMSSP